MGGDFPDFRLGTVLATSFTGTRSERHGDAVNASRRRTASSTGWR